MHGTPGMSSLSPRPQQFLFIAALVAGIFVPMRATAADAELALAMARYEMAEAPVADTWITGRVRASLQGNGETRNLDIRVETVNGVVSLTGVIDSNTQWASALRIATRVKDVKRVDARALRVKPLV